MESTLLLNADAQPISYLPISSISWQEAIKFIYMDAADALHMYEDWEVRSPSITMTVPSVIMLRDQVKAVRSWVARDAGGPQKHLVFLRDLYICQYCGEQFSRNQLTIDHVIPRYYGGRTRWDNITTCCADCNCRRGHDITQQPRVKPFRPTYGQLLKNMRKFPVTMAHHSWNYYLGWEESLVRIVNPRNGKIVNDNFDFGIRFALQCSN